MARYFQVMCKILILILATCSEFGSTKYAIKIAPFNKNKKKNQAAFMINHEKNYYKIRFNAFRVDHDGLEQMKLFMCRNTPLPQVFEP